MRSLVVIVALAGTASAGPVLRLGTVGGTDSSAPGDRESGFAAGAGYRSGGFTAELDYAYLDYDGSEGIGGGSHRLGVLLQATVLQSHCKRDEVYCPHIDLEAGAGRRWIHWENDTSSSMYSLMQNTVDRQGRDLRVGISANFGLRFALDYFVFHPDDGTANVSCRSTSGGCPMQVSGDDHGVLLEVSFAIGG
jgi:hypothetical protein